eukprot:scaffold161074_cov32-Tisochrysis_lutea.AAC.3
MCPIAILTMRGMPAGYAVGHAKGGHEAKSRLVVEEEDCLRAANHECPPTPLLGQLEICLPGARGCVAGTPLKRTTRCDSHEIHFSTPFFSPEAAAGAGASVALAPVTCGKGCGRASSLFTWPPAMESFKPATRADLALLPSDFDLGAVGDNGGCGGAGLHPQAVHPL